MPYLLVAGDREVESDSLAVRTRDGKDLGVIKLEDLNLMLKNEVALRSAADATVEG